MKILIIGVDALEHDLAEEYNLKNLKQKEHGKVRIPIHKIANRPITPQIWASFLSGKVQNLDFEYKNMALRLLMSFVNIIPMINRAVLHDKKRMRGIISKLLRNLGISTTKAFPKLKQKTFLDNAYSEYYNAPFYDFSKKFAEEIGPVLRRKGLGEVVYREFK